MARGFNEAMEIGRAIARYRASRAERECGGSEAGQCAIAFMRLAQPRRGSRHGDRPIAFDVLIAFHLVDTGAGGAQVMGQLSNDAPVTAIPRWLPGAISPVVVG
jgi:hypothetical protein